MRPYTTQKLGGRDYSENQGVARIRVSKPSFLDTLHALINNFPLSMREYTGLIMAGTYIGLKLKMM